MKALRDAFPEGLDIRRAPDGMEVVKSDTGEIRLLASHRGTELVRSTVRRGKRMTLVPPPDPDADVPEVYHLLSGRLRGEIEGASLEIAAGDTMTVQGLTEPVILEAVTDVEFLYFTFAPFFHYISSNLKELIALAEEVARVDGYTADHCGRIQEIAYAIGKGLNLDPQRLHYLDYAAYLHDVGKVQVPIEVLTKPASLTTEEWELMRRHPLHGSAMLATTFMAPAAPIVEQHHERWDGSGYPRGLSGREVLTEAYIVAAADSYDAMTSDRPYRRALEHDEAERELRALADRHYPAQVIDALFTVLPDLSVRR